jgi:alpha-amylase
MDFETFGEHQWEDTGIFNFLSSLPGILLRNPETTFKTPTEIIESYEAVDEVDVPNILTWADTDRDLTAWTGNDIQKDAIASIYALEGQVLDSDDDVLIEQWRKLQTSDHFYYMCTKWFNDGDVHAYFSPYESPYDAYIAFMNALTDLQLRVQHALLKKEMEASIRLVKVEATFWGSLWSRFEKLQRGVAHLLRKFTYKFK